jgi:hypothetical protein
MEPQPPGEAGQQDSAGELIRLNRNLLAVAEQARRNSQALVHRSSADRVRRCLNGAHRDSVWGLGMAEWAQGARSHPPRGSRHSP